MAVPKRKTSKARRDSRRANYKTTVPAIMECPRCHQAKRAHFACPQCGYYDGRKVMASIEEKQQKAKA